MKKIDKFKGDFYFLSNFSPYKFRDKSGVLWQTVEHYFQAMKTVDMVERGRIWSAYHPGIAKKLGRNVELRSDWDILKLDIMIDAVSWKFLQNKDIKKLIADTKDYILIEGNTWHDNIWGDCSCSKCKNKEGKNYLGKILMSVRKEILHE
jgi:ribA/ribD-fused uncharacterized protein